MKKYKDATPEETINKIRTILFNIGILIKDRHIENDVFYSCRVIIGNTGAERLNIGSNGKGRSFEYSLASGYAEFMERLQNMMLLSKSKYATREFLKSLPQDSLYVKKIFENELEIDYVHDIAEERWDTSKVIDNWFDELKRLFHVNEKNELFSFITDQLDYSKLDVIPYYCVTANEVKLLPLDLILVGGGSNGMCAGNSPKEAILQGICEIFERHAASEIYYNNLTPPTIPHDFFKDKPIYEKLKQLQDKSKYDVIIKDCSLGQGFPVIGVIIIDQENQLYNFKLGSDLMIDIALERCLTEIHQGTIDFHGLPFKIFDFQEEFHNSEDANNEFHNFKRIYVNGTGIWPGSIFYDKSSYKFNGVSDSLGNSNDEDLKYCFDLVHKLGYNIYIRDNSFLNFPAYHIVIPGMSQLTKKITDYTLYKKSIINIGLLKRLNMLTEADVEMLAYSIDENYSVMKKDNFDFSRHYLYNTEEDLLDLDVELLLFMLFYRINNIEKAKYYLDIFLADKSRLEYGYYFAISDYIDLKYIKGYDVENVNSILEKIHGIEIINEVISDLSDPKEILQYHDLPNCFECEKCKIIDSCHLFEILKIEKKMHIEKQKKDIQQQSLAFELSN